MTCHMPTHGFYCPVWFQMSTYVAIILRPCFSCEQLYKKIDQFLFVIKNILELAIEVFKVKKSLAT